MSDAVHDADNRAHAPELAQCIIDALEEDALELSRMEYQHQPDQWQIQLAAIAQYETAEHFAHRAATAPATAERILRWLALFGDTCVDVVDVDHTTVHVWRKIDADSQLVDCELRVDPLMLLLDGIHPALEPHDNRRLAIEAARISGHGDFALNLVLDILDATQMMDRG